MTTFSPNPFSRSRLHWLPVLALVLCAIPPLTVIGAVLAAVALLILRRRPDRSGSGLAVCGLYLAGVMLLVPLLIAMPAMGQVFGNARKAKCAAQLRGMANTLKIYAGNNGDMYPAVQRKIRVKRPDGKEAEIETVDSHAAMWLLVTTKSTTADTMVCPSDSSARASKDVPKDDAPFPRVNAEGNADPAGKFRSFSYSYQISNCEGGNPSTDNPTSTRFAIMADAAPPMNKLALLPAEQGKSVADARKYLAALKATGGDAANPSRDMFNSPNHGGEGQNVLYQDGHIEWRPHPWCGIQDDNIYTWDMGRPKKVEAVPSRLIGKLPKDITQINDEPFDDNDSVLVNIERGRAILEPVPPASQPQSPAK